MPFIKQYYDQEEKSHFMNGMIENGPQLDKDNYSLLLESLQDQKLKKRDIKAIKVASNDDKWNNIAGMKLIPSSPTPHFRKSSKSWDKNSFFDSQDNCSAYGDNIKLDKPLDNISVISHNLLGDTINKDIDSIHPLPLATENDHQSFEILSKNQDEIPIDSISNFSADDKLCGMKRKAMFDYAK